MAKQEDIQHSHLPINGLNIHIAQVGKGKAGTVVFLHGFPEIWYTWRHQMLAVADAGFRAVAPDCRGYGLSDQPTDVENASWDDLVSDLLAILDSLAIPKEAGRAEADFGRLDAKTVVCNVYTLFSKSNIPIAAEGQEIMDLVEPSTPLPPWFSEDDLAAYGALYENSGFRYPLQVPYRVIHTAAVAGEPKVEVPALLIMGEVDYLIKFPGIEEYIRSGTVRHFVHGLEITFIPEGTHFVQEQFAGLINKHILDFFKNCI